MGERQKDMEGERDKGGYLLSVAIEGVDRVDLNTKCS